MEDFFSDGKKITWYDVIFLSSLIITNHASWPMQRYPLLPVALCLVVGILLVEEVGLCVDIKVQLMALAVLLVVAWCCLRSRLVSSLLLLSGCVLVGTWRTSVVTREVDAPLPAAEQEYEAIVLSTPQRHGKVVRFDMRIVSGSYVNRKVRATVLWSESDGGEFPLSVGMGFAASSRFTRPGRNATSGFDYPLWLKSHGISAETFILPSNLVPRSVSAASIGLMAKAQYKAVLLRERLLRLLRQSGLDESAFAIVSAMSLGEKSGLSPALRAAYSEAGVSHLLALSGTHLAIIYSILSLFLMGRRGGLLCESLLVVSLWCYVFLVGLPVSALRSVLMLTVCSLVRVVGRSNLSVNSLIFAVVVLLLSNPYSLYDMGCQLSVLSVGSILLLYPYCRRLLPNRFRGVHGWLAKVYDLVCVSCVAQLGTAPLVLYYFGYFPVYFLLANLVMIPLATLVLYSTIVLLLSAPFPVFSGFIASFLSSIVSFQLQFLHQVSLFPCTMLRYEHLTVLQLVILYLLPFPIALIYSRLRSMRRF